MSARARAKRGPRPEEDPVDASSHGANTLSPVHSHSIELLDGVSRARAIARLNENGGNQSVQRLFDGSRGGDVSSGVAAVQRQMPAVEGKREFKLETKPVQVNPWVYMSVKLSVTPKGTSSPESKGKVSLDVGSGKVEGEATGGGANIPLLGGEGKWSISVSAKPGDPIAVKIGFKNQFGETYKAGIALDPKLEKVVTVEIKKSLGSFIPASAIPDLAKRYGSWVTADCEVGGELRFGPSPEAVAQGLMAARAIGQGAVAAGKALGGALPGVAAGGAAFAAMLAGLAMIGKAGDEGRRTGVGSSWGGGYGDALAQTMAAGKVETPGDFDGGWRGNLQKIVESGRGAEARKPGIDAAYEDMQPFKEDFAALRKRVQEIYGTTNPQSLAERIKTETLNQAKKGGVPSLPSLGGGR